MSTPGDEVNPFEGLYFGVDKDIRRRTVQLYWGGDHYHVYTKTITKDRGTSGPPTMSLTYEQAQEMVTQLWFEGIRPKDVVLDDLKDQQIARYEDMIRRYKSICKMLVDIPVLSTTLEDTTGGN